MPSPQAREKIRREIIEKGRDARYQLDAYLFVLDGLEFHLARLGVIRHVNGREFSLGLLTFAHKQFGPLARIVLSGWGINATDDFGRIVYNLINIGVMRKQPEDRLEDFSGVIDLDEFFKDQEWCDVDKDYIKKIQGA
ncbi:MAG: hypothetical protein JW699_03985 [Chitinispirillaceae bacterium]|nr:hypothetical protein [Chitinispirillaceae bacterium]